LLIHIAAAAIGLSTLIEVGIAALTSVVAIGYITSSLSRTF
jgi:hypothetical protein